MGRVVLIRVVCGCAVVTTVAAALTPAAGSSGTLRGEFEIDVSASGDWHAGEPEIAVNPANPRNVVMDWPEEDATGVYRNPATGTFDAVTGTLLGYASDPAFSRCGLALSFDGGRAWRRTVLPAQTAQSTLCSDATVAAGPDGTFYAGVITFKQPTTPLPDVPPGTLRHTSSFDPGQGSADAVIRSTDGGRTWSYPPVDAIGNRSKADRDRYAAGSKPETGGEGTCDRPWLAVDQSTGTVYVSGTADAIQFNGSTRSETWVTASHDRARSFGTVYPVDSAAFPQTGGASVAAANGVLAVAYVGHRAGSSANAVVLATSRSDGRTFARHELTAPAQADAPFGVSLAADPDRRGHYAVVVPARDATGVLAYETRDSGATWSRPRRVSVGASRPWVAFSPRGVLGVMGRRISSDGSQDVLAAFSFDGGRRFGRTMTVNRRHTPAPPSGSVTLYDDVSWLTLTDRYAYLAWGDWRRTRTNANGETNAWMARLPVSP